MPESSRSANPGMPRRACEAATCMAARSASVVVAPLSPRWAIQSAPKAAKIQHAPMIWASRANDSRLMRNLRGMRGDNLILQYVQLKSTGERSFDRPGSPPDRHPIVPAPISHESFQLLPRDLHRADARERIVDQEPVRRPAGD